METTAALAAVAVDTGACSMKCPSGTGHALCGCGIGGQARRSARSVPKAVQKDEMFDKVVEAALDCRNVQEWEEDVWRSSSVLSIYHQRGTRGYKQAAFKSKDKFYGSSSRVPAMTLSKKAKQSSTFDHKNGTTGLRSSIEAKKRFSYLVTSKRKCACKKSAAALNIMDGSTVASAEKHKGMASGQSSSDCSRKAIVAKKLPEDQNQDLPYDSASMGIILQRSEDNLVQGQLKKCITCYCCWNPSWSQLCGSINRMFVAFPLRPGINGIVNQYEFSKHRPGM
uniref:Uncharacterized protein n=1 Tax=Oryza sativa subsp. japonica TaxID=39947 RepID=Q2QXE6_ORYSJ|nr:hypothetical protein LOC_Os12g06300 [Oryza sativa Japonica Group]